MRFLSCLILLAAHQSSLAQVNWPQFRGPLENGFANATKLPSSWSESENVFWKTAIHDRGWSSPVIWGDQVWMTTATRDGKKMYAVCVHKGTGKIVHDLLVFEVDQPQRIANENSYATPTSVIEQGRVYVHFGTYGTACIDTRSGREIW